MAHAGRRPTPSHSTPSPRVRRVRRSQIAKSRCPSKRYVSQPTLSSSDIEQSRPVLVPLHPNLRRLPSRFLLPQQSSKGDTHSTVMRQHSHGSLRAGAKRKRVFSVNENTTLNGRSTRSSGRSKRLRSSYSSGDEDDAISQSEMDVDALTISVVGSDESEHDDDDTQEVDDGVSEENSTDEHLINFADQKQLNRFRKTDLIRLYNVAGLTEDPETLTKTEIIAAIIDARDDYVSVPPSSRTGKSSDYSSDDGNVAGDEETDGGDFDAKGGPALNLRRRATIHELGKSSSMAHKGRSFSMGNIATHNVVSPSKTRYRTNSNDSAGSNSKASISPSPTSSVSSGIWPVRSPPATRLRSRQVSHTAGAQTDKQKSPISGPTTPGKGSKGKAKGKQVGFKQDAEIHVKAPVHHSKDETLCGGESDLTELSELEKSFSARAPQPSPRRLRSKDRQRTASCASVPSQSPATPKKRKHPSPQEQREAKQDGRAERTNKPRVLPKRRVKLTRETSKVVEEDVEEEDELVEDESEEIGSQDEEGDDEEEEDEIEDEEDEEAEEVDQGSEEEEVDELASSASATSPPRTRRTPLRKRLRSRQKQGSAGPSDGDDEGDGGRVLRRREAESPDIEGQDEEDVEADAASEMADDETIAVEPRRLRNGKIVGEEDVEMDNVEDLGEDVEQEEEDDESNGDTVDEEDGGHEDAEGEIDEEVMDEEVDLTIATAKTLVRLRRDDLVRLCESCDLEPVGTKPQLAQALLQWRDRQSNECSSPSSAGTVRPPSTTKRRRYHTRHQSSEAQTPILSRSHRVHLDEPRTPVPDKEEKDKEKEGEQDLELDLESLGLEDREIPPDRLYKLEKIGSGGFKDVYIGKFKGRKIAIAEFRGQLNAMDIKELKLLGEFNHPNIVRFLGVSIPENVRETPVMIVSELCSNGDLFDYIRNVNAPPLRKILVMMIDISRGLEYLHTRKPSVIHRDCKSSNILITSKGIAKIADFGLAKVKQSTRSMVRSLVGTVNWQAPELWHAHPKYNHKADVFSCAAVYWEMLQWHLPKANRKFPWEGMNEHAIYEIVGTKRQRPSVAGLRKQWCPEIIDMIEHMWAHDPQDRPTMSEVVQKLEELVAKF